jgi:signal transduction histidine kinase/DNA-binding response OmpR family regulator
MAMEKIKILAVDDNLDNLTSLKAVIKENIPDAAVFIAKNGIDGLELARKVNPDTIIVDIVMPEMDGYTFCRKIKSDQHLQHIPVIFLTALKANESKIAALDAGCEAFLDKPIEPAELIAQIRAMCKINQYNKKMFEEQQRLVSLVAERTNDVCRTNLDLQKSKHDVLQLLESLTQSETALKKAQNFAKMGQWSHDLKKRKVEWSWLVYKALDIDPEDKTVNVGNLFGESVHPDDRHQFIGLYSEPYRPVVEMHYRLIGPKGKITYISSKGEVTFDAEGKPEKVFGVDQDVTEKWEIQEKLRQSELFFKESQRGAFIGSFKWSCSPDQWESSEVLDTIFGIEDSYQRTRQGGLELIYPGDCDAVASYCKEIVTLQLQSFSKEFRIVRRNDGGIRWVLALGKVTFDKENNITSMIGTVQDITARKNDENALMEAKNRAEENNRLKTAFLNNMSHEIRTPMNAIIGFSELMRDASCEEKNSFAEIIGKSSEQLLAIIDDMLLLARLQSEKLPMKLTEFSPVELVNDVYKMFNLPELKKELDLQINITLNCKGINIKSDYDKVRQVLTNLVSNAIKYTLKGSVEIGVQRCEQGIEFYVKDTGIGIPQGEIERIFDNFYRGEHARRNAISGTGLGLNIASELVDLLDGRIGVNSVHHQGSHFFFVIPAEISNQPCSEQKSDASKLDEWRSLDVMIAEDDPGSFLYLSTLLKGIFNRIDHAADGQMAIQLAGENQYDLILMDIQMPIVNGIEATKTIKTMLPNLPIVAQTAFIDANVKEQITQAGFDGFIPKPIKKADLMETLNRIFNAIN